MACRCGLVPFFNHYSSDFAPKRSLFVAGSGSMAASGAPLEQVGAVAACVAAPVCCEKQKK
jgi:hypothetical protein